MSIISSLISKALNLSLNNVESTITLLQDGATIPFISRYRKDTTGGLDEVEVENIKTQYENYKELEKRKKFIVTAITEQEKMTPELSSKIEACWDSTILEDIYLPYRPKRQTRAEAARKKGLEELATWLMKQQIGSPEDRAKAFITDEVETIDDALKGASDIVAEWVNEDARARQDVRRIYEREAEITSKVIKGKEEEGEKYSDYFDFSALLSRCPSHRLLAIRRGESEGFLRVSIFADDEFCIDRLIRRFVNNSSEAATYVEAAVIDGYKRLMKPSMETEFAKLSKENADEAAIAVFAENMRQLLLAPPLGQKRVLAIDPGFRSGCKVVCLDEQGGLLYNETIYPHPPKNEFKKGGNKIVKHVLTYKIDAIAIGNGTASRETEQFITSLRYEKDVKVFVVSEMVHLSIQLQRLRAMSFLNMM